MREPTRRLLELLGITSLYPPQQKALHAGVEEGESILLAAPTASGKTLVALIAAANALDRGELVVYTAPLRSIVFEKMGELKALGAQGARIRVEVGSFQEGPRDWNLLLSTYERLDSLLRNRPELASKIGLLIVDEIHYIGDEKRGPVLESLLSVFLERGSPQVVALSATVPNAYEIAEWLEAKPVVSEWRPVPLREGVYKDHVIHYANGDMVEVDAREPRAYINLVLHYNSMGGQALVFSQSRRRVASLARYTAKYSKALLYDDKVAREAAARLLETGGPRSIREELSELARRGVAYHHAGLSNEQRRIIEDAFRRGGLAVVHATPTLAAGVNLPARAVILEEIHRFERGRRRALSVAEYKQMAGRAGRPGYDEAGDAIIIAPSGDEPEVLLNLYARASPEPVESRLGGLRGMRHVMLGLIASGVAGTVEELTRILGRTLFARQWGSERTKTLARIALGDLTQWGLVERDGVFLEPTPLGLEVARYYLDPFTVPEARAIIQVMGSPTTAKAVYLIASMPDMIRLPVSRKEEEELLDRLVERAGEVFELLPDYGPEEAAAVKLTLLLLDWIEEVPDDEILSRYNAGPGDLAAIAETGDWIASSLASLTPLLGGPSELQAILRVLATRIRYGIREELVQLVSIPGIGRVRARRLYDHGYRSLVDLAQADPLELSRIPGIGPRIARQILEFLGRGEEAEKLPKGTGLEAFM